MILNEDDLEDLQSLSDDEFEQVMKTVREKAAKRRAVAGLTINAINDDAKLAAASLKLGISADQVKMALNMGLDPVVLARQVKRQKAAR